MKQILVFIVLLVLFSFSSYASDISACQVISSSGEYNLVNNILDSSSTACIEITTSNVILNGNGHIIDGINTANTYGIKIYGSSINNVTIKNVNISNWGYAFYILNTTNLNISNNYIYDQTDNTFYIYTINLSNSSISNNFFQDYKLATNYFIYLKSSSNNIINNNIFNASNISTAISVDSSQDIVIDNNQFNNTWSKHIYIQSSSNRINITNNQFIGGFLGSGYFPQAVTVTASSSNVLIRNNTVYPYYDTGFLLYNPSYNITIENNYMNTTNGIGCYYSYNTIIRNNFFNTKAQSLYAVGFRFCQNITIYNNTFNDNVRWLYFNGTQNVDIYNNIFNKTRQYSIYYEGIFINMSSNITIRSNTIGLSQLLNNTMVYSSDNIKILNNSILNYTGWGIYLNSVTNSIIANNTFNSPYSASHSHIYGISANYINITSNNLTSANITNGIYLDSSSNNIIKDNTVNTFRGNGIFVNGQYNTISNNFVSGQPYASPKFYLGGSYYSNGIYAQNGYNTISNNFVANCTNFLITIAGSYMVAENNILKETAGSVSLSLAQYASHNIIRNNSIGENISYKGGLALILLRSSSGSIPYNNTIVNNRLANYINTEINPAYNGGAIMITTLDATPGPYNNTIANNLIYNCIRTVFLWNVIDTRSNNIYNNTIINMSDSAFYLVNSSNTRFEKNNIINSTISFKMFNYSNNNTIYDNIIENSTSMSFLINLSSNNKIYSNNIKSYLTSTSYHILSYRSNNNNISSNIFNFTSTSGSQIHIYLNGSQNNIITNNIFDCINCSSAIYTMHDGVIAPTGQTITYNRINNFRDNGIYLYSAGYSLVYNNSIQTSINSNSYGINIAATPKGNNNNFNISSNYIYGTKNCGIYAYVFSDSIISNNIIIPSSGYGFYTTSMWNANNKLINNTFISYPVRLEGGPYNYNFTENTFKNIPDTSIQIFGFGGAKDTTSQNITIYKNNIINVTGGIIVNNVSNVFITGNNLTNISNFGIYVLNTTSVNITGNTLKNISSYLIKNSGYGNMFIDNYLVSNGYIVNFTINSYDSNFTISSFKGMINNDNNKLVYLNKSLNITDLSGFINLNISYSDIVTYYEDSYRIYKDLSYYNSTSDINLKVVNANITENGNYHLMFEDTVLPSIIDIFPTSEYLSIDYPGLDYVHCFNATAKDFTNYGKGNITNVYLEFNGINYTAYYILDTYVYCLNNLEPKIYKFKWYATDEFNNTNYTLEKEYKVFRISRGGGYDANNLYNKTENITMRSKEEEIIQNTTQKIFETINSNWTIIALIGGIILTGIAIEEYKDMKEKYKNKKREKEIKEKSKQKIKFY